MKRIIAMFVLALIVISCGARKTESLKSEESIQKTETDNSISQKDSESNLKKSSIKSIDDKNETISKEDVYEPIDPKKESTIIDSDGKKIVLNNARKISKTVTQKNNIKTEIKSDSTSSNKELFKEQKNIKTDSSVKNKSKSKITNKKAFNWFNLLYFIVPIGIISYLFYKFKNKIWWI